MYGAEIMNGGRVAKRLLAVVLALGTLITLGLYYNGSSSNADRIGNGRPRPGAVLSRKRLVVVDRDPEERPSRRADAIHVLADDDVADGPKGARPSWASVDRDTCVELGLANTTIDTVAQFSRFEFQVSSC